MIEELTKLENLETDIDLRLMDLVALAVEVEEWDWESVLSYMRAAFTNGYCQALSEPVRGELCRTHGYRIPERAT